MTSNEKHVSAKFFVTGKLSHSKDNNNTICPSSLNPFKDFFSISSSSCGIFHQVLVSD